jgi:hypothetical protein
MYSSEPFASRHKKEAGGQHHASSVLPLGKTRYSLDRRLREIWSQSGEHEKIRVHRDSIPGPSGPSRVAAPTELSTAEMFLMLYKIKLFIRLCRRYWQRDT